MQYIRAVTLMAGFATGVVQASDKIWLEDVDRSNMTCGWGQPAVARSVAGAPLAIDGVVYGHGVGTHSSSSLTVFADGHAKSFEATVGLDDGVKGTAASVEFKVWADGRLVASSGVLRGDRRSAKLRAGLTGAREVVLEVADAGDGNQFDHADWADAFFLFETGRRPLVLAEMTQQLGILTPKTPATPRINGASRFGVRPGHEILWRIAVSGERPVRIAVAGLPAGARFDEDLSSVRGAVAQPGEYPLTVSAVNGRGCAERKTTLVVGEKIALTPPMGWNSWNVFAWNVTAEKVRSAADAMISSGLADHGWNYINVDDFWQNRPAEKNDMTLMGPMRNPDGTIVSNGRFPDMKGLADYVHGKGLRIGLYSSPGPYTCGGCTGSWKHEVRDAKSYADWGYDYLKYDWCSYSDVAFGEGLERSVAPYRLMGKALRAQSRDIVFSLCQYGMDNVSSWGESVCGSCWRTTGDIFDTWVSVVGAIQHQAGLWQWSGPGAWNDPDMLCVGKMQWNEFRGSRLTPNEQYTHISFWCLVGAPLMIGCDMTKLDDFTLNLLTNDEVIDIDQDPLGAGAARVARSGIAGEVWARPLADGSLAVGLLNTSLKTANVEFDLEKIGLLGTWRVRDLWTQRDEGEVRGKFQAVVFGHATKLIRLSPGKDGALRPGLRDIRKNVD